MSNISNNNDKMINNLKSPKKYTQKSMTYGIGKPGPGLRQAQNSRVKLFNGIQTLW